jgi:hypothetical protein
MASHGETQSGPTDHPRGKPNNPGASQSDRLLTSNMDDNASVEPICLSHDWIHDLTDIRAPKESLGQPHGFLQFRKRFFNSRSRVFL